MLKKLLVSSSAGLGSVGGRPGTVTVPGAAAAAALPPSAAMGFFCPWLRPHRIVSRRFLMT